MGQKPAPPPRLRQPRLADMIAGRFRSQILDGSLSPGERLPRQEALARELGVSLTVVREALRMLEAQGLVLVHRGKTGGATVRFPDGAAIATAISTVAGVSRIAPGDIQATLIALDGLCAQSAAAQPGRAALARQLEGGLDGQRRHAEAGNGDAFRLECARFHAEISRRCGLDMLASISAALETSARELSPAVTRRCELREPGTGLMTGHILAGHQQTAQAIAAGHGPAAARAAAHPPRGGGNG